MSEPALGRIAIDVVEPCDQVGRHRVEPCRSGVDRAELAFIERRAGFAPCRRGAPCSPGPA